MWSELIIQHNFSAFHFVLSYAGRVFTFEAAMGLTSGVSAEVYIIFQDDWICVNRHLHDSAACDHMPEHNYEVFESVKSGKF